VYLLAGMTQGVKTGQHMRKSDGRIPQINAARLTSIYY
jgi:hypothetical protein